MYGAWLVPLLLFAMIALLIIVRTPLQNIVFAAIDDGMYYPKIASNIVQHGNISYDNIHYTNGFHPLWELILLHHVGRVVFMNIINDG